MKRIARIIRPIISPFAIFLKFPLDTNGCSMYDSTIKERVFDWRHTG